MISPRLTILMPDTTVNSRGGKNQKEDDIKAKLLLLLLTEGGPKNYGHHHQKQPFCHQLVLFYYSDTRRVKHLFFTLGYSITLMQSFPDVMLMDCTYKTNKFKLPLLHILGVTPIETNFSAGFCFLPGETEKDYFPT